MVGGSVVGGFNKTPVKDDHRAAPFQINISVILNIAIVALFWDVFKTFFYEKSIFAAISKIIEILGWKWYKWKSYYRNTDAEQWTNYCH